MFSRSRIYKFHGSIMCDDGLLCIAMLPSLYWIYSDVSSDFVFEFLLWRVTLSCYGK